MDRINSVNSYILNRCMYIHIVKSMTSWRMLSTMEFQQPLKAAIETGDGSVYKGLVQVDVLDRKLQRILDKPIFSATPDQDRFYPT